MQQARKGDLKKAEAIYQEILQLEPNDFDALNLLASLHLQEKKYKEAVEYFGRALKINSSQPSLLNNYGLALYELQKYEDAIGSYDKAIKLNPCFIEAHYNRGHLLQKLANFEHALLSYGRVIELKPDFAEAYFFHGNVLLQLQRYGDAIQSYNKAIALKPEYPMAFNNRGLACYDMKMYDEALVNFDKTIELTPDNAETYSNKGLTLYALKRYEDAIDSYGSVISLNSCDAEGYSNIGLGLYAMERYDEAVQYYDKAIELKPDKAEMHSNRGLALFEMKRYKDAIQSYDKAIKIKPDCHFWFGELLAIAMSICNWSSFEKQRVQLVEKITNHNKAVIPFSVLSIIDSLELQQMAVSIYVKDKYPADNELHENVKHAENDKIRIGYYSSDFHNHALTHLMAELFELHDRSRFEFIAFSFGPDKSEDIMRKRVSSAFDKFLTVQSKSDKEIALLSRDLGIDIAVDLNGLTKNCRTGIFALRAAPIQVNYMGYPGTMGTEYIDYIIVDPMLIPEPSQRFYTEKIVYLPNSYQVNDSKRQIADTTFTREESGLPKTGFVFCCFNNNHKITPNTFESWMRILSNVEGSVLWLLEDNPEAVCNLRYEAAKRGVKAERLIFAKRVPPPEHLARHCLADLFLDTLPYNAHTTASDALWAGVPVLTCIGESFASRVAASLLNAIHLPELITTSYGDYEALAVELARNPEKLHDIKNRLAKNRLTTPLFDTKLFTHHIEAAYIEMYERYQADLPPEHLYIKNNCENMEKKIPTLKFEDVNTNNVQQGKNIMSEEQQISIDNVNYPLSSLTDSAKALLSNLQFTENEIARLNTLLAVTKTARATYAQALKAELQKTGTTQA